MFPSGLCAWKSDSKHSLVPLLCLKEWVEQASLPPSGVLALNSQTSSFLQEDQRAIQLPLPAAACY